MFLFSFFVCCLCDLNTIVYVGDSVDSITPYLWKAFDTKAIIYWRWQESGDKVHSVLLCCWDHHHHICIMFSAQHRPRKMSKQAHEWRQRTVRPHLEAHRQLLNIEMLKKYPRNNLLIYAPVVYMILVFDEKQLHEMIEKWSNKEEDSRNDVM